MKAVNTKIFNLKDNSYNIVKYKIRYIQKLENVKHFEDDKYIIN